MMEKRSKQVSLSIILLMYNEQNNILSVLEETLVFAEENTADFEIIVVDDGSCDQSAQIVSEFILNHPDVSLIRHEQNRGMGAGMRTGITRATKDFFVINAADGQVAAAEIGKLLQEAHDSTIVLSTYEKGRESMLRGAMSRCFRYYLKAVADMDFQLEGLYLYPTKSAQQLVPQIEADTFFFSFELIERGVQLGLKTTQTQMLCRARQHGRSKVTNPARIKSVAKEAFVYGIGKKLQLV